MALSMLTLATGFALPQGVPPASLGVQSPAQQPLPPQPPPQQIEPQPSAPPAREENPGLFNEIGKLFEKSKSMLPPLKTPSETFDDLLQGALLQATALVETVVTDVAEIGLRLLHHRHVQEDRGLTDLVVGAETADRAG